MGPCRHIAVHAFEPQLAPRIATGYIHGIIHHIIIDHQGMVDSDRHVVHTRPYEDGCQAVVCSTVSELAVGVSSCGIQCPVEFEDERRIASTGDFLHTFHDLHRKISSGCRSITKLADAVVPHRQQIPVHHHDHGMGIPARNLTCSPDRYPLGIDMVIL